MTRGGRLLGDLGDALSGVGASTKRNVRSPGDPGSRSARATSVRACVPGSHCGSASRSIRRWTTRSSRPKGSARPLCAANGDDFGAARAWRLVNWARYGLCQLEGMREPARARMSTTAARRIRTTRRTTSSASSYRSRAGRPRVRGAGEGCGDRRARSGPPRRRGQHALCFLGQLRGMLGQRDAAREMILKGVADRQVLGDLPGAAMSRGEGLGYFVEMIRGDRRLSRSCAWHSTSCRRWATRAPRPHGGLALPLPLRAGRSAEADECARVSENAAAKRVAAQVSWRGARALLLAREGDVGAGEALAREAVGSRSGQTRSTRRRKR